GELLGAGMSVVDLNPIRTQSELLNRYWSYRIIRSDGQGDGRETVLRSICEHMVETRTLKVERSAIDDASATAPMHDLLSTEILSEWQPSPGALPDRYIITFSHNILFDYAVARLLLRLLPEKLIKRFVEEPELALVIRPSVVLHYRYLWAA